jgi:hypothetical protein
MLLRPRPTPPDRARRHRIEELRRGGSPALPNRARRHWIEGAPRQIEEGEEKVAGGEEGEADTKLAPPNRSLTAPDLAAAAPASRCQVGRRPPRPLHPPQLASVVGAGMVSAGERRAARMAAALAPPPRVVGDARGKHEPGCAERR